MNEPALDLSDCQHLEHSPGLVPSPLASYGQFILCGQINAGALRCHTASTSFISPLPEGQCALHEQYFTEN